MKKIKYLLFIIPFLFALNVYATDYNISSNVKYNVNLPGGSYGADDINDGYNTIMGRYNVGTRYNGRIGYMEFFVSCDSFNCSTNHTYTITLNMATNDWRNNFMGPQVLKCNNDGSLQTTNYSLSVSNFRFISRKQIKFNFKTNSTLSPYYKFVLYSNNYASQGGNAITGDSNWNLSSIIISDNVSSGGSSGGSSGTTPTPTPTPSPGNQDIINNNNSNTQNIIDNSTQNTTDIINNNNHNTQDIIDNQNSLLGNCDHQQISNISSTGSISTSDYYYETEPLDLQYFKKGTYYWGFNVNDLDMGGFIRLSATLLIWYNDGTPYQEIHIEYDKNGSFVSEPFTINSDNVSSAYFRFLRTSVVDDSVKSGNFTKIFIGKYQKPIDFNFGSQKCTSRLEDVANAVSGGANTIINNANNNTQDIIKGVEDGAKSITDNIDKQFMNCTSQVPKYITSFSGHIYGGTSGMNFNPSNANILVYEVPEVGKEYSVVFNKGVRLRIGSSDTLFTSMPNVNSIKLNYVFSTDSPVVGNTYSFTVYNKYIYVNMYGAGQGTSVSTDITFNGVQVCTNRIDDTNKGINEINDNLTDETVPDIDLDLDLDTNSPVSDLLTMPITILNKVFDSTENTCQPYVLPFDFTGGNNTLTFPCIDLKDYLGNSVYNILDTILCFFFCYEIGMMCISIYEDITSLHDGFDALYTPKHGKPLGKHTREVE